MSLESTFVEKPARSLFDQCGNTADYFTDSCRILASWDAEADIVLKAYLNSNLSLATLFRP